MMATEWLIEDKRIPKRDISQQDFAEELNEIPPEYLGPGPASVWSKAIKEALDVVTNDLVKQHKIPPNRWGFLNKLSQQGSSEIDCNGYRQRPNPQGACALSRCPPARHLDSP